MGLIDEPAYMGFCLTDTTYLGGHPGTLKGLQAHLDFLPSDKRIVWTVMNFGGNLFSLASAIISLGGHISIGLGDSVTPAMPTSSAGSRKLRVISGARSQRQMTPSVLAMH